MTPQEASPHPFSLVCLGRIFGYRARKGVEAPAKPLSSATGESTHGTPHIYLLWGSDISKAPLNDPRAAAAEGRQTEDGWVALLARLLPAVLFAWEGPRAVHGAHAAAS